MIANRDDLYTDEVSVDDEIKFDVPEDGDYQVAFVGKNGSSYLQLESVGISEVLPYDIQVAAAAIPTQIPEDQATDFTVSTSYTNKGTEAATVEFKLKNGDQVLGTTEATIAADATETVSIKADNAAAATGQVLNLTIEASVKNHPEASIQVPAARTMTVSDDILAYDNVTADLLTADYAVGYADGLLGLGQRFTITSSDILTGISVGWTGEDAISSVPVRVYKFDNNTLSATPIVDTTIEKGSRQRFVRELHD